MIFEELKWFYTDEEYKNERLIEEIDGELRVYLKGVGKRFGLKYQSFKDAESRILGLVTIDQKDYAQRKHKLAYELSLLGYSFGPNLNLLHYRSNLYCGHIVFVPYGFRYKDEMGNSHYFADHDIAGLHSLIVQEIGL